MSHRFRTPRWGVLNLLLKRFVLVEQAGGLLNEHKAFRPHTLSAAQAALPFLYVSDKTLVIPTVLAQNRDQKVRERAREVKRQGTGFLLFSRRERYLRHLDKF